MKYAIVENSNVVNVIEYDGEADLSLPEGCSCVLATADCAIGGTYDGTDFTLPVYPTPDTTNDDAWSEATADWLDNGIMGDDEKWKRCIKSGNKIGMDSSCWTALLLDYPQ